MTASQAIAQGLASDGGLFVPESIPRLGLSDIETLRGLSYGQRASFVMKMFLDEFDTHELGLFAKEAYSDNFDSDKTAPLHIAGGRYGVLELLHGPTCAFKDMRCRCSRGCSPLRSKSAGRKGVCILLAPRRHRQGGLEGFRDESGTRIFVFYPRRVSDVHKLQMITHEGGKLPSAPLKQLRRRAKRA